MFTCIHIDTDTDIYTKNADDIMFIIVGNGYDDTSSNPGRS